jgi:hypothetical protein
MSPVDVLAHGGHLHPAAWAAVAIGALVPLVALVVIVVLTERRR